MSYSYVKYRVNNKTPTLNLASVKNKSDQLIIDSGSLQTQSNLSASTGILQLAIVVIIVVVFYLIFRRRFKKEIKGSKNDI